MKDEPPRILSRRPGTGIDRRCAPTVAKARAALGALALGLALGLALTLAACDLDLEKETILIRYDPAVDVAQIRLIYEGIHSSNEFDTASALSELEEIVAAGSIFYLFPLGANWWADIDLADSAASADRWDSWAFHGAATLTNGKFFRNDQGKLSAWQDLRIESLSRVVAALNDGLRGAILVDDDREAGPCDSGCRVFRRLLREEANWLWLDRDGFGVLMPVGSDKPQGNPSTGRRPFIAWRPETARLLAYSAAPDRSGLIKLELWGGSEYQDNLLSPAAQGGLRPALPGSFDGAMTTRRLIDEFRTAGS